MPTYQSITISKCKTSNLPREWGVFLPICKENSATANSISLVFDSPALSVHLKEEPDTKVIPKPNLIGSASLLCGICLWQQRLIQSSGTEKRDSAVCKHQEPPRTCTNGPRTPFSSAHSPEKTTPAPSGPEVAGGERDDSFSTLSRRICHVRGSQSS